MDISNLVVKTFKEQFDGDPRLLVRAPGRVNLIGEHTDYNDGFVLPMAIDRAVWIALRPRHDRQVCIYSVDYDETAKFYLEAMQKSKGWVEYIKGVASELQHSNFLLQGWDGVLGGDIPKGAGLSSSAGVELAATRAFSEASNIDWHPSFMAQIGQKAENNWVGVNCGIMDQMVSAAARAGHALFLDCRSLEYEHVPLPENVAVVVMDTSTRRGLVDSAYNERRTQCEAGAAYMGVKALRDVSLERFDSEGRMIKDEVVMRRTRHIVSENQRVLDAVSALHAGDVVRLGRLFNESHVSLRDDFEVTNEALNQIVDAAQAYPACFGARMTGAGFGGCAVALVERNQVSEFVSVVMAEYRHISNLDAEMYVCQPSEGASSIINF